MGTMSLQSGWKGIPPPILDLLWQHLYQRRESIVWHADMDKLISTKSGGCSPSL